MRAIRVSTVISAAVVLAIAALATRARLDVGIALAVVGLLLALALRLLAIPVVALVAGFVCDPHTAAMVTLLIVTAAAALGLLVAALSSYATLGSTISRRGVGPGGDWWGFSDGWGRGRGPGGPY